MLRTNIRPVAALRVAAVLMAAMALILVSFVAAPAQAQAATASTSRVASLSAGPAKAFRGNAITVQGQVQRLSGKSWVKTKAVTLNVYFDPDGAKPKAKMRSIKSNASGSFKTAFAASVSGKWTVNVVGSTAVKASASAQRYVQVVAKPAPRPTSSKPASRNTCPSWAPIKGNASSHIYHLPGQRFYKVTNPEICFSTEAAARAGGYRKSKV